MRSLQANMFSVAVKLVQMDPQCDLSQDSVPVHIHALIKVADTQHLSAPVAAHISMEKKIIEIGKHDILHDFFDMLDMLRFFQK